MEIGFNVHDNSSKRTIENEELVAYSKLHELEKIIPNRYSWLFVFHLLMLEQKNGVSPSSIINEIKILEGLLDEPPQTKPASAYKHAPLIGLWHKHFFAPHPSILAHNIKNQLARGKLEKLILEVFAPKKSAAATMSMIDEMVYRVVVESLENRAKSSKLTGEWIVFAKHEGQNYYLCISNHESGYENISHNVKEVCIPQFPFLSNHVS